MTQVEISFPDAEGNLRTLIERAGAGEAVVLVDKGEERARLVAVSGERREPPQWGLLRGKARMPTDVNAPLPEDLLDLLEGR